MKLPRFEKYIKQQLKIYFMTMSYAHGENQKFKNISV